MKYLSLTSKWIIGLLSVALFIVSGRMTEADPTDDFSFTLGHPPVVSAYRLLNDQGVGRILEDRLDLFPKSQIPKLAKHIVELCNIYRFDPAFVLSLIEVESRFNVKATSPVGAIGLMQLMLPTANFVAHEVELLPTGHETFEAKKLNKKEITSAILYEPFANTSLGIAYLSWLRDHYHGSLPYYLVAAYLVGPARMDELMSRKSFRPRDSQHYFRSIRQRVNGFRFYQTRQVSGRSKLKLAL